MTPERAKLILGDEAPAAKITARSKPNYYGGAWVIFAAVGDFERPLTQFVHPFQAARWIHDWERLMGRMAPLPNA